ncbi:hypothetical protein DFJ74DRAFT_527216 [Hyaloraphidium curvatum]|nr:hypothetical protein DFJ74DRAFT_527216 [Hyaloraphidium curvatum]
MASSSSAYAGAFAPYQDDEPSLLRPGPSASQSSFEEDRIVSVPIPGAALDPARFETSLPIRLDIEAALCYVLGCVSGVFFLMFETRSNYVRFHAYQSSIFFLGLVLLHFVLQFISSVLSWMLFAFDLICIAFLSPFLGQTRQIYTSTRYRTSGNGLHSSCWTNSRRPN